MRKHVVGLPCLNRWQTNKCKTKSICPCGVVYNKIAISQLYINIAISDLWSKHVEAYQREIWTGVRFPSRPLLNLPSTLTYYINLDSNKVSNHNIKQVLSRNKFKDFRRAPGYKDQKKINGISSAHENILLSLQDYDKPFIILEEDIEINNFIKTITIPDDADAFYLGLSCMGAYNGTDQRQISAKKHSKNVYRIYNMLAAHAIVYLNSDYVKEMIRVIEFCRKNDVPHDIGIAEVMKYWNVYGLSTPMFYQTGKYEKYTNLNIDQMNIVGPKQASIFKSAN